MEIPNAINFYAEVQSQLGDLTASKADVYKWLTDESHELARKLKFPRREVLISSGACCEVDFYIENILNARPAKDCKCRCHEEFTICSISQANKTVPNWNYDCHCPNSPKNLIIFDPAFDENKIYPVNVCCDRVILEVHVRLKEIREDEDLVWTYENTNGTHKTHFAEYAKELLVPKILQKNLQQVMANHISANDRTYERAASMSNMVMRDTTETMIELENKLFVATDIRKVQPLQYATYNEQC